MEIIHNWKKTWTAQRIMFLISGIVILASIGLGHHVSEHFLILGGLAGLMQVIFSLTGFCPMVTVLKKLGFKGA